MEPLVAIRFGILTVSDRCSIGETEDKSGPALESAVREYPGFGSIIVKKACVPDNVLDIVDKLKSWSCEGGVGGCDVILTTGGTGFAARDVTPEATLKVITKRCDALAMMGTIRSASPFAFLSRAAAGIREKTIIINFPGSARAATECFKIVAPLLPHAVQLVSGNIEAVTATHSLVHNLSFNHAMSTLNMHHAMMPDIHSLHLMTEVKQHKSLLKSSVSTVKSGLRPRESQWPMISLTEAQNLVLEIADTVSPCLDNVPLMECLGRIGGNCTSSVNLPPFRASVKDGYAVRVADGASHRIVVAASSAGDQSKEVMLKEGECVRINTGAPLPPGADAVVQVEDTRVIEMNEEYEEIKIDIVKAPHVGLDIREIGSDMAAGCVLMTDGDKISSSCLGVLASAGITYVPCWSVKVCIFSTGDELIECGEQLSNGKIYDSNRHTLISLLKENSFPSTDGGIIRDQPDEIYRRLHEKLKTHDVIITTGSVSMGDKDFLKQVLTMDLKAKIHFGRIDLKPGKPTTFADLVTEDGQRKLIFSLPGNPVSAAVTCHLLVLPALRKITKHKTHFPPTIRVQVAEDVRFDETRKEFKRAVVTYNSSGLPIASVSGGQASSRLGSMLEANALITCDNPVSVVSKGSEVDALIIGQFRFPS